MVTAKFRRWILLALLAWVGPTFCAAADPKQWAEDHIATLVTLYEELHAKPELSFQERDTAERIAREFEAIGARVTRKIGGYGVVGVLKNGNGKRLLLRTDLDALPIIEETGLPYASTVRVKDPEGTETVGVMHACGHDLHMTNLVGVAQYMSEHRSQWKGEILFLAQPAEERLAGAKAMLGDGLYQRFGKPDFALALHVAGDAPVGTICYGSGPVGATADWVDITVRGSGGHGARPHETKDPIVQAAQLILALQTIVSRDVDPIQPAVVTVGAIHGGTKHNIIPDQCQLKLTVRCYAEDVRKQVHLAIRQRAEGIAASMGAPAPDVKITEATGVLYNEPSLIKRLLPVLHHQFGPANVIEMPADMGSEDFAMFAAGGVPIFMFGVGCVSKERIDAGDPTCLLHTPRFSPEVRPTLVTAITTMSAAALDLLSPQDQ